ncbi:hypothetical protein B0A48_18630 [Cryoendolithus antarcticus]|uniref:Nonsense-mediated mRNA decay factor n=1 Tax=Cryoendolithus antarcticus TaxID=1507870 RepID=A0A1V8S7P7_9PEZI|nr:hypothetical protein B0A48_18630 [Cryoendolithus antarcticus]
MHDELRDEYTPSSQASHDSRASLEPSPDAPGFDKLRLQTETPPGLDTARTYESQPASSGLNKRFADGEPDYRAAKRSPSCEPGFGPNHAMDFMFQHKDSGYCTMDCTGPVHLQRDYQSQPPKDMLSVNDDGRMAQYGGRGKRNYAATEQSVTSLRSQPETIPVSREQLAVEVKGIYAGLVMVEAKCVNIDNQKAADLQEKLSPEQWQALIALHRTVVYEHHDFLMATQHPAATPALRGLATKYCMPARMWKHGIHAFLEVLRYRRPESQEYMLSFIYLAYQMMALLLETVSSFTDTWTECLGDLARYRMAIEEDKESHAAWGDVARSWYQMASDRHPAVGRLYHHLGILQRPSLCKLYYYSRSLTSVIPFYNARESLTTLCAPILKDDQALKNRSHSAEAMAICFSARVFAGQSEEIIIRDGQLALSLLDKQPSIKIASYGVHLVVTSIAALLSFGAPENHYRQMFDNALNYQIHVNRSDDPAPKNYVIGAYLDLSRSLRPLSFVTEFLYTAINTVVRRHISKNDIQDLLPSIHISLAWLSAVHTLRSRFQSNDPLLKTITHLIDDSNLDWSAVAELLNATATTYPITSRIELFARQGMFPTGGKPLHEDYSIRGLVWAQWYFSADWFAGMENDDGSRALDDAVKKTARAERAIWLGLRIARQPGCFLRYDESTKRFSAANVNSVATVKTETTLSSRASSTSPRASTRSSLESDFVLVSQPPSPPAGLTYASVAADTTAYATSSRPTFNTILPKVHVKRQYKPPSRLIKRCSDSEVKVKVEEGTEAALGEAVDQPEAVEVGHHTPDYRAVEDTAVTQREDALLDRSGKDSAVTPPRRPAYGSQGQRLLLWTNYFCLQIEGMTFYRFAVSVNKRGKDVSRGLTKRVIQLLIEGQLKDMHIDAVSDFRSTLISRQSLNDDLNFNIMYRAEAEFEPEDDAPQYQGLLEPSGTLNMSELVDYSTYIRMPRPLSRRATRSPLATLCNASGGTESAVPGVSVSQQFHMGSLAEESHIPAH